MEIATYTQIERHTGREILQAGTQGSTRAQAFRWPCLVGAEPGLMGGFRFGWAGLVGATGPDGLVHPAGAKGRAGGRSEEGEVRGGENRRRKSEDLRD